MLQTIPPLDLIDQYFIPALDVVGDRYEKGKIFLPQLMQSAEAVKASFEVLKANFSEGEKTASKGKIIVATVLGDIHDIGKNIAKMLLENYGYDVIDLGKDVPIEKVVQTAKRAKDSISWIKRTDDNYSKKYERYDYRYPGCWIKLQGNGRRRSIK